jgi:hypothetical protein
MCSREEENSVSVTLYGGTYLKIDKQKRVTRHRYCFDIIHCKGEDRGEMNKDHHDPLVVLSFV